MSDGEIIKSGQPSVEAPDGVPPRSARVLVVDDDPDQRMLICDSLRLLHHGAPLEVHTAATGAQALSMDLGKFDVILQDYNLPDMSGLDLLKQVLRRADVPVILVTGENDAALAAEAISLGAQDYVVKLGDYLLTLPVVIDKNLRQHRVRRENERLREELQCMLEQVRQKNEQLRESMRKLERMAATDSLTGLANRRRFNELLELSFSEASRYNYDLTCCMCDLDHYKTLNDTLGHQVGDELLVATADVVRSSLRASDVAGRYGGDELVLLLPHTPLDQARAVLERIRRQLAVVTRPYFPSGGSLTLSIGMSSLLVDKPSSPEALLRQADTALYMAKDQGRDRIVALCEAAGTAA
jgi:two-component system chemotaxis family response regulator WspR